MTSKTGLFQEAETYRLSPTGFSEMQLAGRDQETSTLMKMEMLYISASRDRSSLH